MSTLSDVTEQLIADGMIAEDAVLIPVTGGVSCEVWRVSPDQVADVQARTDGLIVKAPLARLRVPTTWGGRRLAWHGRGARATHL